MSLRPVQIWRPEPWLKGSFYDLTNSRDLNVITSLVSFKLVLTYWYLLSIRLLKFSHHGLC